MILGILMQLLNILSDPSVRVGKEGLIEIALACHYWSLHHHYESSLVVVELMDPGFGEMNLCPLDACLALE